jgi:small subunit ribosomal protein S4
MARDTGATCRYSRRYQLELDFKTRGDLAKGRKGKPGQHGTRRPRETNYGLMLAAKQALKLKFGMLEKPFRNLYKESDRLKGPTGDILLQLLESRLDNVVFRMGFAATRREARQLVGHKAILVNGCGVNIASYRVKPGDVISVRERSRGQTRIQDSIKQAEDRELPEWFLLDLKKMTGEFKRIPDRDELPTDINEQLIVEFYSK